MTVLIRFQSGHSVRFRDLGIMVEEELATGHRRQPQPDFTFTAANPALQLRRRGLEPTHPLNTHEPKRRHEHVEYYPPPCRNARAFDWILEATTELSPKLAAWQINKYKKLL